MKIGFFTDTYLPNIDGVVSSILSFKSELEQRGHKIFVFSSGNPRNSHDGIFFYRSIPFAPYPQYRIALFPFTAKKQAKKNRVQLIHCHAMASMGLAAIKTAQDLRLPLVGTFHTMLPKSVHYIARRVWSKKIASRLAWRWIKNFYKPFDIVTAPTHAVRDLLEEHGVNNVVVVPNGVDANKFSPRVDSEVVRKLLGIQKNEKIVLIIGRMSEEKNVDVIIKAAEKIVSRNKIRFVVTGEGPALEKYRRLVARKNLSKHFLFKGFVQDVELPFYYAACDVMATASTFDTFGLTVMEAMACGKPVVGANALAVAELVEHERNGFLFKPFDSIDCAEKILCALNASQAEKKKLSREARKTALRYSIKESTEKLLRVYEMVL